MVFFTLSAGQGAGWCAERLPGDLVPIVILKKKPAFTQDYSIDSLSFKNSPFTAPFESLSAVPVDLQSRSLRGGVQTDFSLRGADFQGTAVLLNGQRINDPQTAHYNSDIPLTKEDIEKIRVFPGGGSSLFGPDAIGGAIQVIPKKPACRELIAESSGGGHNTASFLLSAAEKTDVLGARLSVEQASSSGFYEDTDFKTVTAAGSSWLDLPQGEVYAITGYQKKAFGAYDFYTPGSGYLSREETETMLCSVGGDAYVSGIKIQPAFLWRRHFDTFILDKSRARSTYESRHRTDVYDPSVYIEKEAAALGTAGVGLASGADDIDSSIMGSRRRYRRSIFFKDNKEITPDITAGFSARRDDIGALRRLYSAAMSLRSAFSPGHAIHVGLSRSIRAPSFTELYYADPTTRGNEELSAGKAVTYQCGYDYRRDRVSADATAFFRAERGGIDWVKKADAPGPWRAENIGGADVFGLEAHCGARSFFPGLDSDLYYTYLNKIVQDDGYLYKYGPNYIRHLVNVSLSMPLPLWTQSIVFIYKKKPGRRGWLLADLQLSRGIARNGTLFVKAANVLNVEYQEIEGIPQPGRWITAGIRAQW
jgi:iron complex outermembrane receptor protein